MKLPPAMTSPETRAVFKALGGDTDTRFVGGCVRDAVLGHPTGDIDLATRLKPNEVMQKLKAAGLKAIPTGLEHGTITAVSGGIPYEITTLRRDVETDGRWAQVEFTDDWQEDASRRDFTINTLLADLSGNIYEPLGVGLDDLKQGRVRFVGEPAQRIKEDTLRIIRFFRFHSRYGKGRPDKAALLAFRDGAYRIKNLSKERVTSEIIKLLNVSNSSKSLKLMRDNSVLSNVIHSSFEESSFNALIKKQKVCDEADLAARLLLISGLNRSGLKRLEEHLRLPGRLTRSMINILDAIKVLKTVSRKNILLSLYRHGKDATLQALYLTSAPSQLISFTKKSDIPVFPITGKQLLAQGLKAGPELGKKLAAYEKRWIAQGFPKDFKS